MFTIVSRKTNCARTSACSRSFSSQSAAAAATASTSSGSSASEGSWMSAPTSFPFRLTSCRRRVPLATRNGVPSRQHELLALGQPVDEVERRVAQGVGDRVPQRDAAAELDEQVGDAAAGEPAAEHAGEERHRHERERDQEEEVERLRRVLGDRVHDQLDEEDAQDERARAEHRAERPAQCAARAEKARDDDRDHGDRGARSASTLTTLRTSVWAVSLLVTAIVLVQRGAARVGLLVDQQLREGADEDERVRADHEPEVAASLEPARSGTRAAGGRTRRARGC